MSSSWCGVDIQKVFFSASRRETKWNRFGSLFQTDGLTSQYGAGLQQARLRDKQLLMTTFSKIVVL
jgi:hypothetical protein